MKPLTRKAVVGFVALALIGIGFAMAWLPLGPISVGLLVWIDLRSS
jgi:hypothetical protein